MLGTLGRLFLLRFLPRRLVPFIAVYQVYRLLRGRRAPARTELAAGRPNAAVTPGGRARVG
jgi:hypothetical protein